MPNIHASTIALWQDCRRKWYFSDEQWGLGYRPDLPSEPLTVGTWVHEALQSYYEGEFVSPWDVAADLANEASSQAYHDGKPDLGEALLGWGETAYYMLKGYIAWLRNQSGPLSDNNFKPIALEQDWEFTLDGQTFAGRWDGIFEHVGTGDLWVYETKTTSNPASVAEGVYYDWQPRLYVYGAQKLYNQPVRGVIYSILKRANPYDIKVLKSGLPSTAKNELAGTTYEAYKAVLDRCINEFSLDRDGAYHERKKELEILSTLNGANLYRREQVSFSSQVMDQLEFQLLDLIKDVNYSYDRGEYNLPRLDRWGCVGYNPCPYRWACQAMDDGADWKGILDTQFTKGVL